MFLSKKHIGRRAVLKGVGVTLALPLVDAMIPASTAWADTPAGKIPKGLSHRKPTAVIHGIPVYRLPSSKGSTVYLVPELGVRVGASGPMANQVLAAVQTLNLVVAHQRKAVRSIPGRRSVELSRIRRDGIHARVVLGFGACIGGIKEPV